MTADEYVAEYTDEYTREVRAALVRDHGWAFEDALAWTTQRAGTVSASLAAGRTPADCAWALRVERAERFTCDAEGCG